MKKKVNIVWEYFGDCRNTVDKDNIWDATQMAQVVEQSKKAKYTPILKSGDRNIPKKTIGKKGNIITINKMHKIGIVYNPKTDIHHFFDIKEGK